MRFQWGVSGGLLIEINILMCYKLIEIGRPTMQGWPNWFTNPIQAIIAVIVWPIHHSWCIISYPFRLRTAYRFYRQTDDDGPSATVGATDLRPRLVRVIASKGVNREAECYLWRVMFNASSTPNHEHYLMIWLPLESRQKRINDGLSVNLSISPGKCRSARWWHAVALFIMDPIIRTGVLDGKRW